MTNNSIEKVWEQGYINHPIIPKKINSYLDHKSLSTVEKMQKQYRNNVMINIPIIVVILLLNIVLQNDPTYIWAVLSILPGLYWWRLGKKQLQNLSQIDYLSTCYDYMRAVRDELNKIQSYNYKLALLTVPVILTPMLVYTYYNQQGKTLGEVWGCTSELPLGYMFMAIPMLTLAVYLIILSLPQPKYLQEIDALINEMEEIKNLK